jgi:hypothetical protein
VTDPIDITQFGLGAIPSPSDDRDWQISQAYADAGLTPFAAPPAAYMAPTPYPPVYNQGASPRCVAYSSGGSKVYQDLRDTGLFTPNQSLFYAQIGGTATGAVPRVALSQMLNYGYPPATGLPSAHKIKAYYAVPTAQLAIQQAIMAFGPVLIASPWYNSWFRPVNGVLPAPDTVAGGHEFYALGYETRGPRCRNSWGTAWGIGGDFILPWSMLHLASEAWKTLDVIDVPSLLWLVKITTPTKVYAAESTTSKVMGPAYSMSAKATRHKVNGRWWYHIVSARKFVGGYVYADGHLTATRI